MRTAATLKPARARRSIKTSGADLASTVGETVVPIAKARRAKAEANGPSDAAIADFDRREAALGVKRRVKPEASAADKPAKRTRKAAVTNVDEPRKPSRARVEKAEAGIAKLDRIEAEGKRPSRNMRSERARHNATLADAGKPVATPKPAKLRPVSELVGAVEDYLADLAKADALKSERGRIARTAAADNALKSALRRMKVLPLFDFNA